MGVCVGVCVCVEFSLFVGFIFLLYRLRDLKKMYMPIQTDELYMQLELKSI